MKETVIVEVRIEGFGAGLAAAWLASKLDGQVQTQKLLPRGIPLADNVRLTTGHIEATVSTRAPDDDEVKRWEEEDRERRDSVLR
jgi:hypothetical protein